MPYNFKMRGKMKDDCLILLEWACKNGDRLVSLSVIAEETGIPFETLRLILNNATDPDKTKISTAICDERKRPYILLSAVAEHYGFMYHIYKDWNKENRWKHRKKIIDATKWSEPVYSSRGYEQYNPSKFYNEVYK